MKLLLKICSAALFLAILAGVPAQAMADNFSQVVSSTSSASQINSIPFTEYSSSTAHIQLNSHSNKIFNQASAGKRYSGNRAKNLIEITKRLTLAAGTQATASFKQLKLKQQSIINQRSLDFARAIEQDRTNALIVSELQRIGDSQSQAKIAAEDAAADLSQFDLLIRQERAKTAVRVRQLKQRIPAQPRWVKKRKRLNSMITQSLTNSKRAIYRLQSERKKVGKLHDQAGEQRQLEINRAGLDRVQVIENIAAGRQVQAADIITKEITASEKNVSEIQAGIAAQFDGLHASCQSSLRKLTGNKKFRLPYHLSFLN